MTNPQDLRKFRAEIPAPDEESRRRIYARATTARAPRLRGRRWALPSLTLAAGAAAAAVAILLVSPWGGSGNVLAERALAAIGDGPVLHIVMTYPPNTVYFDLKTGRATPATFGSETWIDQRHNREHMISTEGGRAVGDFFQKANPPPGTQAAFVSNFFVSLVTGYRIALLSGTAKIVERGTAFGHRVYWLRFGLSTHHSFRLPTEEVGVDARTYKPVLLRFPSGKRYEYARVLLAKAIAYDSADFRRSVPNHNRRPVPIQAAPGYEFGSRNPSAPRSTVVRAPWLSAGTRVAGLELRAVAPFTIHKTKHRFYYGAPRPKAIHGLELVYGPSPDAGLGTTLPTPINVYGPRKGARATTRSTIIYELPRAPGTGPWSSVPAGSIEVQTTYTNVGNHVVRTPWIGYLRKQGLYITIATPKGARAALQIARSLDTGRK